MAWTDLNFTVGQILTAAQMNNLQGNVEVSFPVGEVIAYTLSTPPEKYLACDGSAVSRTTYAALFNIIGSIYGSGDGSTTFNLPDYRGKFLRGFDNGASNDPDAASRTDRGDGTTGDNIGTQQADDLKSHLHNITTSSSTGGGSSVAHGSTPSSSFNSANTGGNETRPLNVYVLYCIRY